MGELNTILITLLLLPKYILDMILLKIIKSSYSLHHENTRDVVAGLP